MDFRKRYVAYLNRLQAIARKHDELTDTDVRERLHEVINYFFIWGKPLAKFPKRFDMMSAGADRDVATATRAFISEARKFVDKTGIEAGAPRHALIEDDEAKARNGDSYDVYLGSSTRLLAARRPTPDSYYSSLKHSKKKRPKRPTHALDKLTVTVRGITVTPTWDAENGFYQYELRNGSVTSFPDGKQSVAVLRRQGAIAVAEMLDDEF